MKIENTTEKTATQLVTSIVEGIQEKKGHHISVADLTDIDDTICQYLVICDGNSPSHISAIYESVREMAQKHTGEKPNAVDGLRNSLWVAMDYADVVVHIFLPETRQFYDIDHLWEDAQVEQIPDLD
ncbi:MAG: ribosome silencing factor [Bacteroidaceae bacterium]|nr:ribosome silencing factor [Bacteroidaceae bacterium]